MAGRQGWNLRGEVSDRLNAKGQDHPLWKGDAAADDSKRMRAQKMYSLGACEQCGKPAVDRHHVDGDTGNNTADNVMRVCRRCHMVIDGRLDEVRALLLRTARRVGPLPCVNCHAPSKPLRHGRCDACSMYYYRKGVERPLAFSAKKRRSDLGVRRTRNAA